MYLFSVVASCTLEAHVRASPLKKALQAEGRAIEPMTFHDPLLVDPFRRKTPIDFSLPTLFSTFRFEIPICSAMAAQVNLGFLESKERMVICVALIPISPFLSFSTDAVPPMLDDFYRCCFTDVRG